MHAGPGLPRIYIAGPLSDAPERNTRAGIAYARELIKKGWAVFLPHLYCHIDEQLKNDGGKPFDYETWMAQDFSWISACHALFKWAPSPGADREHELANRLGIPVFITLAGVPHGSVFLWEHETKFGGPQSFNEVPPRRPSLYSIT